jgi:uncharacterized protein YlxW (UPF0749 family)
MQVLQFLNIFWNTAWGKFITGSLFGLILAMLALPSVTKVSETREDIRKELEKQYASKVQEQEHTLQQTKEFYEKELSELQKESSLKQEELTSKLHTLTSEVSSLKKNTFTETIEIRRPDGTVEKRKTTHSTLETINQKVAEVKEEHEKRLKEELAKQQESYERSIKDVSALYEMELASAKEELEVVKEHEEKTVETYEKKVTNTRRAGVGVGYTSNKAYAAHAHYYVHPAFFVGTGVEYQPEKEKTSASILVGVGF